MRFQLLTRSGLPDFLDLPWDRPLETWRSERLVEATRGIGRHVVRFVEYDGATYALKELPDRIAEREYRLLRALEDRSMPVVELVGIVTERSAGGRRGGRLDGVLVTRYLDHSLPYRALFANQRLVDLRDRLLDALAELLVRLHLAGFFWGDCSLSNTLFRRDAGALAAYVVDTETGELQRQLSEGQRAYDLEIAEENLAGELLDLIEAERTADGAPSDLLDLDPIALAAELRPRYERLWAELTADDTFRPDERYRLAARIERLNELGFDVEEIELVTTESGYRLRLPTRVVEPGHHQRRLQALTGIVAGENQARRLLNDLRTFKADLERGAGRPIGESAAAARWRLEAFDAAVEAIPADLRASLDPAQLYHEILEHRWYRSEAAGRDVGLAEAVRSYVREVLRREPDERPLAS
ncbi:MAG TPA: DUF4032 domain-containing protein [Candidatus Limnocylindrales bacterium]|nr:DUF4032 domain-containing protein [Candidatus Limnocylindrales bacterium]